MLLQQKVIEHHLQKSPDGFSAHIHFKCGARVAGAVRRATVPDVGENAYEVLAPAQAQDEKGRTVMAPTMTTFSAEDIALITVIETEVATPKDAGSGLIVPGHLARGRS